MAFEQTRCRVALSRWCRVSPACRVWAQSDTQPDADSEPPLLLQVNKSIIGASPFAFYSRRCQPAHYKANNHMDVAVCLLQQPDSPSSSAVLRVLGSLILSFSFHRHHPLPYSVVGSRIMGHSHTEVRGRSQLRLAGRPLLLHSHYNQFPLFGGCVADSSATCHVLAMISRVICSGTQFDDRPDRGTDHPR